MQTGHRDSAVRGRMPEGQIFSSLLGVRRYLPKWKKGNIKQGVRVFTHDDKGRQKLRKKEGQKWGGLTGPTFCQRVYNRLLSGFKSPEGGFSH